MQLDSPPMKTDNSPELDLREVKERCSSMVRKRESSEEDHKGQWRELDQLLQLTEPSDCEPIDMDISDLLDFEPYVENNDSKCPRKRQKQKSYNLDRNLTSFEVPASTLSVESPPALHTISPAQKSRHAVIDLTKDPSLPELKPQNMRYTEECNISKRLKPPQDKIYGTQSLPAVPVTRTVIKTEPDMITNPVQNLHTQQAAGYLLEKPSWQSFEQLNAQDHLPASPPRTCDVRRTTSVPGEQSVLKQDLGQRRFPKLGHEVPHRVQAKPGPPQACGSTRGHMSLLTPAQSKAGKSINNEPQNRPCESMYDNESSGQTPSTFRVTYLNDFAEALPSNAPSNHPHLISITSDVLSEMDAVEIDSLTLPDITVSILYHYVAKSRDLVAAFLDRSKVNHFFFKFHSRSNKWHSWSIEREHDTMIVGIERNTRPHNDKSTSPSNGQSDFYLEYQLQNCPKYPSPRFSLLTGVMPKVPTPHEFLFNTFAGRGADQHVNYSLLHQPPSDGVRALTRYMWFSAFRASAMEAEFQVAYGRKIRYDKVIGRVRAIYDYALKGAKTQALKRARGDYNRPVLPVDESKETSYKRRKQDGMLDSEEDDSGNDDALNKWKGH